MPISELDAYMITIWTYDYVPGGESGPRGLVRDLRLRWACEEAGLDYEVKTTPFEGRNSEHFARQPFGQIPFLDDDGIKIFESGACLLHLAQKSDVLMPTDTAGQADTLQWTIAALNSIEMVSVPWMVLSWSEGPDNGLTGWLDSRLAHMEAVLAGRDWIAAGRFTVADIMLADVFRQTRRAEAAAYPNIQAYKERVCDRPAFKKVYADQVTHFVEGDRKRGV